MMHPQLSTLRGLLAAALCLATLSVAQAHYLWIERSGADATVYFGEFEESARERSPGRLDEMPAPRARLLTDTEDSPVALSKRPEGFVFASTGGSPRTLIVEEQAVGVRDWTAYGLGIVKPLFYARHQPLEAARAPSTPALPLDILPTANRGVFKVFFNGQPLAGTEVKIVAPNTWSQEGKTDAEGRVRLPMPWRGQYVLQAVHMERTAGTYDGKPYEARRHRTTLTVVSPRGQR
jgi:hypothetical protein